MKYLACFRPSRDLIEKLNRESGLVVPSSGFHCTLWKFSLLEKDEEAIIEKLSALTTKSFTAEVIGDAVFDFDSYVLLLRRSESLLDLHTNILLTSETLDNDPRLFTEGVIKYGMRNYSPHITISKGTGRLRLSEEYLGIEMYISQYLLMKKKDNEWRDVAILNL